MSLIERARKTRSAAGERDHLAPAMSVSLRQQVQEIIPVDRIAQMVEENPARARNELKRACDEALQAGCWAAISDERKEELVEALMDEVFGFGPLEELLADPSVTEVMVNGAKTVFFERAGRIYEYDRVFAGDEQLRALIDRILGPLGRRIDEASPMVDARLPAGHRVNAIIPPLSRFGPALTIRKFTEHVMTLEEMRESGSLDQNLVLFMDWLVRLRKNVAVAGGTGSGKTTLLNALSCRIPSEERIITIEDSAELRFLTHPDVVSLEARPPSAEGTGEVTIRELVKNALRMRPDRIVVGECRGAEALDMLQAMNTGHDGSLTTLHANAPKEAITRLSTMVRYAVDLPIDVVEANIASAIDVIVQVTRDREGARYVCEVSELSFDEEKRRCVCRPLFVRGPLEAKGAWVGVPEWLDEIVLWGIATSEEVEKWKCATGSASQQRSSDSTLQPC